MPEDEEESEQQVTSEVTDVVSYSLYSHSKVFFDYDWARIAWPHVLRIIVQKMFKNKYVLFVRDQAVPRDKLVENDMHFVVTNKVKLAEPGAVRIGPSTRWIGTTDDDRLIQFHNFSPDQLRSVLEDYYTAIRV